MVSFLYDLKGQVTVLNGIGFILLLACCFYRYRKLKGAKVLSMVAVFIFLVCATPWVPKYFVGKLEREFTPLNPSEIGFQDSARVLILVLGSGYTLDNRLPANAQLGLVALGRLAEGIRVHRSIPNSHLICSGFSPLGLESQAEVTRRAAIVLGVDSATIETLKTPSTTKEEAGELAGRFDKKSRLILVTDALHMRRAVKLFRERGFTPIAAPTNFRINEGPEQGGLKWWPSVDNINLVNYYIHESLGDLKASLF